MEVALGERLRGDLTLPPLGLGDSEPARDGSRNGAPPPPAPWELQSPGGGVRGAASAPK